MRRSLGLALLVAVVLAGVGLVPYTTPRADAVPAREARVAVRVGQPASATAHAERRHGVDRAGWIAAGAAILAAWTWVVSPFPTAVDSPDGPAGPRGRAPPS